MRHPARSLWGLRLEQAICQQKPEIGRDIGCEWELKDQILQIQLLIPGSNWDMGKIGSKDGSQEDGEEKQYLQQAGVLSN